MSQLDTKKLSEKKVNIEFFKNLVTRPPMIITEEPRQNIKLTTWQATLSCTREYFYVRNVEFFSLQDIIKKCGGQPGSQPFEDYMSDMSLGFDISNTTKELLLDDDDEKPLYTNYCGRTEYEYHLVEDKVLLRTISSFEFRGASYNSIFENLDLTKFVERNYDIKENGTDAFDPLTQSYTEQEALIYFDDNKMWIDSRKLDHKLLSSWMIFQFLKQIFPVTFDPFFEKNGLIHIKSEGYRDLPPTYKIPKDIVYLSKTIAGLKLCRMHHDGEWF